jgi:hypothetical protein
MIAALLRRLGWRAAFRLTGGLEVATADGAVRGGGRSLFARRHRGAGLTGRRHLLAVHGRLRSTRVRVTFGDPTHDLGAARAVCELSGHQISGHRIRKDVSC